MYKIIEIHREYVSPRIIPVKTENGMIYTQFEAGIAYLVSDCKECPIFTSHLMCVNYIDRQNETRIEKFGCLTDSYYFEEIKADDIFKLDRADLIDRVCGINIGNSPGNKIYCEKTIQDLKRKQELTWDMLASCPEFFEV